jgi:DNA-binding XRE family transcriptional regulator
VAEVGALDAASVVELLGDGAGDDGLDAGEGDGGHRGCSRSSIESAANTLVYYKISHCYTDIKHYLALYNRNPLYWSHNARRMNVGFAERLTYLRAERLLTQQQLAERAGVATATIGRCEAGGYVPHGVTLQKIAAALEVPVRELITPEELMAGRRRGKGAAA